MPCKHFGRCGGCSYLALPYEEELGIKKAKLAEILGEHGHLLETVIPSPKQAGYRNKMEFAFGDDGLNGKLTLGIRKKRSMYEVAEPSECELVPDSFKSIAALVQNYFRESGEPFYHRKKRTGSLRHLTIRQGEFTGEILVMLSTTSTLLTPLLPLVDELRYTTGFLHSVNDGVSDVVKNDDVRVLHGRDFYKEKLLGLEFEVAIGSFFQTNSGGAEVLYTTVRELAKQGKLAYDLYCGTGTITRIIAPLFEKVIGIEESKEAVKSAKARALPNTEYFAGDVLQVLSNGLPGLDMPNVYERSELYASASSNPDLIVLDPPRDGLNPKLIPYIAKSTPAQIVYVACKPQSLARDMRFLGEYGYKPVKIKAVDMFPRTPHVECVALLEKQKCLF